MKIVEKVRGETGKCLLLFNQENGEAKVMERE